MHSAIALSNQEDLSISKYSHIACLILKANKQFILNQIQENFLVPYQTLSSSAMTNELCFRLCRRWIMLIDPTQMKCICLYTISKLYEIEEYLGEIIPTQNCSTDQVKIYSITDNPYILPALMSSTNYDWSFDGCYYLHGIQTVRVNLWLYNVDYVQAIEACRKHCQILHNANHYSYFISRKKSCYCLPIEFSQASKPIALRKPLIHCSFLPYICQGFSKPCENYYSETNNDTLIKIDVQQRCVESNLFSFIFDRTLDMCLFTIRIEKHTIFSKIIHDYNCIPLTINTYEEWSHLLESSWITYSKNFIWISQQSKFNFNDLYSSNNKKILKNDLCMIVSRTKSYNISYEFVECNEANLSGYFLCIQKPLQTVIQHEEEFHMIQNESTNSLDDVLTCPPNFVLFNKICYYIHTSFIYGIQSGEQLCYNQYPESRLVKFDVHEWGNINTSRFLGRTYYDILLEFLSYILEKKLSNDQTNEFSRKHWLRLLFGDHNDANECILRYFVRRSGAFTSSHQCVNGGYPVCQCEPIQVKRLANGTNLNLIEKVTTSTMNTISFNSTDGLSTIHEATTSTQITMVSSPTTNTYNVVNQTIMIKTTRILTFNSTDIVIMPNETITSTNFTITKTTSLPDENLVNNETINYLRFSNNTSTDIINKKSTKYQLLIVILTGPILVIIILLTAAVLFIVHICRKRDLYSTSNNVKYNRRAHRSSTILLPSENQTEPVLLTTQHRFPQIYSAETDKLLSTCDTHIETNDIELLTKTSVQIVKDDDESLYAIIK